MAEHDPGAGRGRPALPYAPISVPAAGARRSGAQPAGAPPAAADDGAPAPGGDAPAAGVPERSDEASPAGPDPAPGAGEVPDAAPAPRARRGAAAGRRGRQASGARRGRRPRGVDGAGERPASSHRSLMLGTRNLCYLDDAGREILRESDYAVSVNRSLLNRAVLDGLERAGFDLAGAVLDHPDQTPEEAIASCLAALLGRG